MQPVNYHYTNAMPSSVHHVAIIGAGPAGLMAAEILSQAGVRVDIYDAMPSVGRKFLMAGKGGMNITHAEPYVDFLTRYGARNSSRYSTHSPQRHYARGFVS